MSSIVQLFSLSLCAATLLLIAGEAIPASRRKLSMLLDCRHPVMERQASFNTGLTLCACVDLSHTGHAYSAVELLSNGAVVLMLTGFAQHFELVSFFRTLYLATVFALTFAM